MKMRSKIVTCLALALSISCLATGCKKKAQETETSSETIRVTEKQTESETAKQATNNFFKVFFFESFSCHRWCSNTNS